MRVAGTVKLNAKTWAFGLKRDFPSKSHGLEHGRCRGTTGSCNLTIINSISWEDQDCKSYDTALSRYWLCETIMQADSESAIYWCWQFCKEFVAQAKKLGNRATLPQMEGQTIKIDVWGHRQLLTVVELWDELEESWRKLVGQLFCHYGVIALHHQSSHSLYYLTATDVAHFASTCLVVIPNKCSITGVECTQ